MPQRDSGGAEGAAPLFTSGVTTLASLPSSGGKKIIPILEGCLGNKYVKHLLQCLE